ncbi:XPG domain containing-domain-containing protein [Xylaria acuta]|nr:XPG domain containing-domain-containing protein [Xylaria acuta]
MGIRGLGAAVRQYGTFSSLSGNTVVVDGPALIYQILDGCMRQRPATNAFICHPSYSTLGRMVIGWLEELRRHNVTVRNIYFDGYLPPGKWQVRRERLLRQSQTMKDLLASHPHGSSRIPEDAFETIKPEISLTQNIGHSSHSSWLPKPPFLVPAVIEILKSCRTWGPLVKVVSGEADMFCAEDVRRHGGVVLTSDSDLLITELGPDGTVSFFADVVAADRSDKSQGLVACKFSLHTINNTLGLNNVGGLPRVAFEKVSCRTSFNEALKRAKNNSDNSLESSEFRTFMEEYSMKEHLPKGHPVQGILSSLDPRISEVIIQTLLLDGNGAVPDAGNGENSRGPETLAMFLPIMIEVSFFVP